MKKFVTTAIAAAIAAGSLGLASTAASAQSRGDRQEHRQEQRRDDRRDARDDRRDDRRDARDDRRDARQDQRAYSRYQRAERRYDGGRWQQPRGTRYQVYGYGQRLPSSYNSYVVNDYNRYGLRAPPRGYHYVRNGNDVVLAAVAGGLITAVIAGLFN
jgi:Ni/Co efflux regulator RcnB